MAKERAFHIIKGEIIRSSADWLSRIYCIGEGLENKLKKEAMKCNSLDKLVNSIVSRRYTRAAVNRMMIYLMMGVEDNRSLDCGYARILAASKAGQELIKRIKKDKLSKLSLITNVNKEYREDKLLETDILAGDMYNLICGRDSYRYSDRVMKPFME